MRKVFVVFTLKLTILCAVCPNIFSYLYAQKLKPELIACNQSAQARYKCFMKQREGELERAKAIGALNSIGGLLIGYLVMSFGIFLIRQNVIASVPDELLEAARIDGAILCDIFNI